MDTKKVLGIIFSIIFICAFGFCIGWAIINWEKVKASFSGTSLYTNEDIQNSYQDGYDQALIDKGEYETMIVDYRDTITTLNSNIDSLTTQIGTMSQSTTDYETQINNLTELKTQNELTIANLTNTINSNTSTIERLNEQVNSLKADKISLTTQVSDLNNDVNNKARQITNYTNQISSLQSELETKRNSVVELNSQITSLQSQIATLTSTNNSLTNEVNELNDEIDSITTQLNSLISSNNEDETTISSLNTQIVNLQNQISNLNNTITTNETKIRNLNTNISTLNATISSLQSDITEDENTIENLENTITNLNNEKTSLQNEISSKNETISNLNGQINELQTLNNTLNQNKTLNENTISELNGSVESLNTQITELTSLKTQNENAITELNEIIDDLRFTIANKTTAITNFENQITELNSQIDTLNTQISDLNEGKTLYEEEITLLTEQKNSLSSQIESLNTQIQNDISSINTLNEQLSTLNLQVTSLTSQSTLDSQTIQSQLNRITELENSLSYYNNVIGNIDSTEKAVASFEVDNKVYVLQILPINSKICIINPASTPNFIFNYWTVNNEQVDLDDFYIYQDTRFVANVTHKFDVMFSVNEEYYGDTEKLQQLITENTCCELPDTPNKMGYDFDGWTIDGENIIDVLNYPITQNTIFIPKYTKLYFVRFVGAMGMDDYQEVREGNCAQYPMYFYFDEYTMIFNGWKVNDEFIDLSTFVITQDTEIVADITYKYPVEFRVEWDYYDNQTVIENQFAVKPEDPIVEGYAFDGWAVNGEIVDVETYPITTYTTFEAVLTRLYNVNFVYENDVIESKIVRENSLTTPPQVNSTMYKEFNGWKLGTEFINFETYNITNDCQFVADITYYYEAKFTVDNEDYDSQIVLKNNYANTPMTPYKEGHTFSGWSLDGENIVNISETKITGHTTFIALFTVNQYTVTFYYEYMNETQQVNYGDCAEAPSYVGDQYIRLNGWKIDNQFIDLNSYIITKDTFIEADITRFYDVDFMVEGMPYSHQLIESGKYATTPNDPTVENYEFDGWTMYSFISGNSEIVDPSSVAIESMTYFEAKLTRLVNITFMSENEIVRSVTVREDELITPPEITNTTYKTFNGWSCMEYGNVDFSSQYFYYDTTIYADYTYSYDVNFVADGQIFDSQIVTENCFATLPLSNPNKEGYTFKGWTIDGDNIVNLNEYNILGTTTIIAKFEINKYSVSFELDGMPLNETQLVEYKNFAIAPQVSDTYEYKFKGWKVDGEVVNVLSYEITQNTTFEANISRIYDVEFMVEYMPYSSQRIEEGCYPTTPTNPTLTGQTFKGWTLSGNIVNPSQIQISYYTTFEAVFEMNTYTVTFKNELSTFETQNVSYMNYANTPISTPTKLGHTFIGWSLDGVTSTDVIMNAITQDTTFVALYEKNNYTVIFKVGNETFNTQSVAYENSPILNSTPSKDGYEFNGWTIDGNTVIDISLYQVLNETTFVAKFTKFTGFSSTSFTNLSSKSGKPSGVSFGYNLYGSKVITYKTNKLGYYDYESDTFSSLIDTPFTYNPSALYTESKIDDNRFLYNSSGKFYLVDLTNLTCTNVCEFTSYAFNGSTALSNKFYDALIDGNNLYIIYANSNDSENASYVYRAINLNNNSTIQSEVQLSVLNSKTYIKSNICDNKLFAFFYNSSSLYITKLDLVSGSTEYSSINLSSSLNVSSELSSPKFVSMRKVNDNYNINIADNNNEMLIKLTQTELNLITCSTKTNETTFVYGSQTYLIGDNYSFGLIDNDNFTSINTVNLDYSYKNYLLLNDRVVLFNTNSVTSYIVYFFPE